MTFGGQRRAHWRIAASILLLLAGWGRAPALAAEPKVNSAGTVVVRFPSEDGLVEKADLLAELGAIGGLDLHAVEWLLPDGELDLTTAKTKLRLTQFNRLAGRYATARISRQASGDPELVIEFDRAHLRADQRRAKVRAKMVSLKVLDPRGTLRARQPKYGLILDDRADEQAETSLVIGIHGFNSGPGMMAAFLDPLRAEGRSCASFVYPNDQPIIDSARLLSQELSALARRAPRCRVALVAFSMGGLVARAAIEDPQLDSRNVERLIMIATPNQGSVCARYARGFDLFEHVLRERQFEPRRWLVASMLDGLGEARQDLCPDSAFLRALNARPRNKRVGYSILLGKGGELDPRLVDRLTQSIDRLERRSTLAQIFGPKLDRIRADLKELTEPGDGFLSVRRGRLEGVDDIEVLPFGHVEAFDDQHDERVTALQQAVARRLKPVR